MKSSRRWALIGAAALALGTAVLPAAARRSHAPLAGEGAGLTLIANVEYPGGTDMEFLTQKGRDYAITGSAPGVGGAAKGAMRVIDITDPAHPFLAATLACSLYQMDVQISFDERTAILAAGSRGGADSCLAVGRAGFMTVDISDVLHPRPLGFAPIGAGSHNTTAHPTQPIVYNSDSGLAGFGQIQIWSIADPANPKLLNTVSSLPHSPHDISFNAAGTLAVSAAISHVDLWDTSNPVRPVLLHTTQCPGCSITHDAKFTPDGKYVIVGDEAGGGLTYPCPGGALYFYMVQGSALVLTGIYEPDEVVFSGAGHVGSCTSHVLDVSDDGRRLAVSWYSAGTRYLDISSMTGAALGGTGAGVREAGWFIPTGASSWSSKFHKGPYIFSNDMNRGLDVFLITGSYGRSSR